MIRALATMLAKEVVDRSPIRVRWKINAASRPLVELLCRAGLVWAAAWVLDVLTPDLADDIEADPF